MGDNCSDILELNQDKFKECFIDMLGAYQEIDTRICFEVIHEAFAVGNWDSEKVDLYLPYLEGDKLTILRDSQESISKLGLDFNTVFKNTSTSYDTDDQGRASGKTGSDVERILAFHELGVPDPVPYIDSWEVVLHKALDLEKKRRIQATP